jgi:hypothetical protein
MESRLSRSLFMYFSFTRWNLGYHKALSRISFSHDGISAITKPFHEFLFHTMESRLSRSLFTIFFHTMEFTKCTISGKTLFIYITKSIYIGSASLKTLPLDLEPLCKEKSTVLLILMKLRKRENVFIPEITYRFVTRILIF